MNDKNKIKKEKALETIDNFVNNLPPEKIKYDEFSMIEEITTAKLEYNKIKQIFNDRINLISDVKIKTINDI